MVISDYFVCESANFNPRIKVPLFFDPAQAGLLENVQNHFSRHLRSCAIAKKHSVYQEFMDSMTSCMDFMIFDVHYGFCDFSASKMPRKVVLYIFQQPTFCRIQNSHVFYSRIRIGGSLDKTVASYNFVAYKNVIKSLNVITQLFCLLICQS